MPERGSAKLLQERTIPEKELERLWKLIESDKEVRLVHWWIKGQPAPDEVFGTVRVPSANAASFLSSLVQLEKLRLRLDVFPYGVVAIDELAVSFQRAGGTR